MQLTADSYQATEAFVAVFDEGAIGAATQTYILKQIKT
jgi:hypothetical protein